MQSFFAQCATILSHHILQMSTPTQYEGSLSLATSSLTSLVRIEMPPTAAQCRRNGNQVCILVLNIIETTKDDAIDSGISNKTGTHIELAQEQDLSTHF